MRQNKGISSQRILVFIVLLVVAGFLIGLASSYIKTNNFNKVKDQVGQPQEFEVGESSVRAPSPTFKPLAETVKTITGDQIILYNPQGGDMIVPKDPQKVKIYQRKGSDLQEITFEDVRVGQRATLKILIPGKSAELIIEE